MLTGEAVGLSAFSTAFFIVAGITVLAVIPFLQLGPMRGVRCRGTGFAIRRPANDRHVG
jgi:hypothetical protein